jgi:hypothetical protein
MKAAEHLPDLGPCYPREQEAVCRACRLGEDDKNRMISVSVYIREKTLTELKMAERY